MNPIFMSAAIDYSKPIESLTEKLTFGGMILLIGIAAVFAVLFTIYLSLVIFKLAFSNKNTTKSTNKTSEVQSVSTPQPEASDDAIIAVIAAAIAAAEEENPGKKFRVVSFRRT